MSNHLVHIGFGNVLAMNRVVAISSPGSAPVRRLVQEAKKRNAIIDLTSGRKTKAIVFLDTGNVVLAALTPETIAGRAASGRAGLGLKTAEGEESHG